MISSEICRKCAECCKNYPYIRLSQNEVRELENLTGLTFVLFAIPKSEGVEEYFMQFKENGDCFFLNENNGDYSCSAYEARSEICRKYPSTPSENQVCEANRKMILRSLKFDKQPKRKP
ncbi:MAG: YkgJ family cysteine cluster protein [Candidatus Aminicenantes bacterium]|nr:YkgJ family cysteine cluster protein [Candidatus Aminicenantes bacterium]